MNLKLEIEFSKAPILQEIDNLKKQIDDMRPLPSDVEGRVMQKLRLDWNYNSNAIEGNKLSYGETVAFLMEGITAKGKPLKDHLDIRGHNEAINFLLDMVKDDRPLSEADIRGLHEMILVEPYDVSAQTAEGMPTKKRIIPGVYKTTANHVQTATGETHYYAAPEETPAKMRELLEWYYEVDSNAEIHPVVVAALFHHKFVAIHPFDDGNGRLSRILMNLVLLKKGYPPVVVKMDDRRNYYSLLSRADRGENWPFIKYIAERLQWSLELYIKGINGATVDEDDDIDKEIALLRIELKPKLNPPSKASIATVNETINEIIVPFLRKLSSKLKVFDEFFEGMTYQLDVSPRKNISENLEFESLSHPQYDLSKYIFDSISPATKIKSIILNVNLFNFRNPNNVFDSAEELYFDFLESEYSITHLGSETKLSKFYAEKLTVDEQNLLIKHMIKNIKNSIDSEFDHGLF